MKKYNGLWEQFITKENFELALHNAKKRKSNQHQVQEFMENDAENLENLRQLVITGKFHTSDYKSQTIYEPKERIIYKLPFDPDRVVQHAVMNVLKPILTNLFIENTFACVEGRGQHKASIKCSEFVRRNQFCLKCDVHHFYPSINQQILSEKFHRIILDEKFMNIVDDIIFSFPGETNIPIGNLCSQWFGNYYLSFLDNLVYHELKCHDYERYCDDFLLFSNDKKYLQNCKNRIEEFLGVNLHLEYSKAEVFDVKQGVDFCGYRHFNDYVLLRKSTALRLRRRLKEIEIQIDSGNYDYKRIQGQLASAKGLLKHASSFNLRESIGYNRIIVKFNNLLEVK